MTRVQKSKEGENLALDTSVNSQLILFSNIKISEMFQRGLNIRSGWLIPATEGAHGLVLDIAELSLVKHRDLC